MDPLVIAKSKRLWFADVISSPETCINVTIHMCRHGDQHGIMEMWFLRVV
jgi:hypothetical protein